jgi:hypothetical protein
MRRSGRGACRSWSHTEEYAGRDWPQRARRLEQQEPRRSTRRVVAGFLKSHHYERTWRNSFFEILEPPVAQRGPCR